jgi:hypothetical protein
MQSQASRPRHGATYSKILRYNDQKGDKVKEIFYLKLIIGIGFLPASGMTIGRVRGKTEAEQDDVS